MTIQQSKYRVIAVLLALPIFAGPSLASDKPPAELRAVIPAGTTLLDYRNEDLNGDGRKDVVFIVDKQDNDEIEEGGRILLIAVRQADNKLQVVKRNDRVVFCKQCGGVLGDPFNALESKPNSFSISHYGGSAWRWSNTFTFAYSRKDDSWQLIRVDESAFHSLEPEKIKHNTYKPPKHFGKIDIADFNPEKFKGVGPK